MSGSTPAKAASLQFPDEAIADLLGQAFPEASLLQGIPAVDAKVQWDGGAYVGNWLPLSNDVPDVQARVQEALVKEFAIHREKGKNLHFDIQTDEAAMKLLGTHGEITEGYEKDKSDNRAYIPPEKLSDPDFIKALAGEAIRRKREAVVASLQEVQQVGDTIGQLGLKDELKMAWTTAVGEINRAAEPLQGRGRK